MTGRILLPDTFIELAEDSVDTREFFMKQFEKLIKPEKHIVVVGVEL